MQSHFPPGEDTVLYISVITSGMHRRHYLHYTISPGLFGEMKALKTLIRVTRFVCPFTAEQASVIDKLLFSEKLWPQTG